MSVKVNNDIHLLSLFSFSFFPFHLSYKFLFGWIRWRILGRLIQPRQIYILFILEGEEEIFLNRADVNH